ncbi:winged helix-turn-helix domain-containing protein [Gottfriedia luciferensis]|uniref:winged helix-turn-helix domain-containing protein n=1 Tax=Gottfriedia luciferensis TaxID=178774 RepID=UPI000B4529CB|nr:response regulator transcription factor [Gottfriedia luciferensis]
MEQVVIIQDKNEIEVVLQQSKQFGLVKISTYSYRNFKEEVHLGFLKGCIVLMKSRALSEFIPLIMRIRRITEVPIILLVDTYDSYEAAICIEAGADEYVKYPIHPRDLSARIKAVMRRCYNEKFEEDRETVLKLGDISIYLDREEIYRNKMRIELNGREYSILLYLIKKAGIIVTREELMEVISVFKNKRLIDIYIHGLRTKIEELPNFPKYIKTIKGKGYRFETVYIS